MTGVLFRFKYIWADSGSPAITGTAEIDRNRLTAALVPGPYVFNVAYPVFVLASKYQ